MRRRADPRSTAAMTFHERHDPAGDTSSERVRALLAAAGAPTESGPVPGESEALAAFRAAHPHERTHMLSTISPSRPPWPPARRPPSTSPEPSPRPPPERCRAPPRTRPTRSWPRSVSPSPDPTRHPRVTRRPWLVRPGGLGGDDVDQGRHRGCEQHPGDRRGCHRHPGDRRGFRRQGLGDLGAREEHRVHRRRQGRRDLDPGVRRQQPGRTARSSRGHTDRSPRWCGQAHRRGQADRAGSLRALRRANRGAGHLPLGGSRRSSAVPRSRSRSIGIRVSRASHPPAFGRGHATRRAHRTTVQLPWTAYREDVRGDRVEVVIDAGGEVRNYEIEATRNGRRVEIETGRGMVTVSEVTRSGTPVRTARFMASRILALVEHPAADQNIARDMPGMPPIRPSG